MCEETRHVLKRQKPNWRKLTAVFSKCPTNSTNALLGLLLPVPVLDFGSLLTHLSAVPRSGVGLLCNLIIRVGGRSIAAQQHAGCPQVATSRRVRIVAMQDCGTELEYGSLDR